MPGPLDGIKVVDVTEGAQGPWAGALLTDLGADVIKIERHGGEMMRRGSGRPAKKGHALANMGLNHGKRCVVLDLKEADDTQIALQLVKRADVFLENWRAGVGARLGLGYDDLAKINPGIVYASGSAHGYNNAYASKPGVDTASQAMSGMSSISGPIGGPPESARFTILDLTTPLPILQAIILALIARDRTGEGQWVQCSQTETGIVLQATRMAEYFATKVQPEPQGSGSSNIVPSQSFKTSDGFIDIEAPTQKAWQQFCKALGLDHLETDPKFETNANRVGHKSQLLSLVEPKFLQHGTNHWLTVMAEHDVPSAPVVMSIKDLYSDQHIVANNLIETKTHPEAGPVRVPALPWTFSRTPAHYKWLAPSVGSHQKEIMSELKEVA